MKYFFEIILGIILTSIILFVIYMGYNLFQYFNYLKIPYPKGIKVLVE
jgi:hypothetical protein